MSEEDKQLIVDVHNELRAGVNPTASGMQKMVRKLKVDFMYFVDKYNMVLYVITFQTQYLFVIFLEKKRTIYIKFRGS